jgi:IPT/TIG domain
MRLYQRGVLFGSLLALGISMLSGCNNTLNPLCGSARPAPVIGSISPSTINFTDLQQGVTLTVNGSQFVSSSQVVINTTPVSATVVSDQQLKVKLSTAVITEPGQVKVMVQTPSGNSGNVGCSSGGNSSVLMLTVN